jgi:hypothetical protein
MKGTSAIVSQMTKAMEDPMREGKIFLFLMANDFCFNASFLFPVPPLLILFERFLGVSLLGGNVLVA